jgi:hypothetical protein
MPSRDEERFAPRYVYDRHSVEASASQGAATEISKAGDSISSGARRWMFGFFMLFVLVDASLPPPAEAQVVIVGPRRPPPPRRHHHRRHRGPPPRRPC